MIYSKLTKNILVGKLKKKSSRNSSINNTNNTITSINFTLVNNIVGTKQSDILVPMRLCWRENYSYCKPVTCVRYSLPYSNEMSFPVRFLFQHEYHVTYR